MIWQTILAAAVFLAAFVGCSADAQKAPFTIMSPTDGATVREVVEIAVSRGDLPKGGFAAMWIDGHGVVAEAVDDDAKAFTFQWDPKEPLIAPELPTKKQAIDDGEHSIKVVGYTATGAKFDESDVKVRVQNKIHRDLGSGIALKLAFKIDQSSQYEQDSLGRFTEADGTQKWPLLQLQPLTTKRRWTHSVADIVSPDSCVLWRKFDKDGSAVGFGYQKLLGENNRISYIYQETDNWTKPTARSRAIGEVGFDGWISYPDTRVLPGDKWRSKVRILVDEEGDKAIENAKAVSVFEGLEWESGIECAKIVTQVSWDTGGATLTFPSSPDYTMDIDRISGTITSYASLRTSRLVKVIEDLEFAGQFRGTVAQAEQTGGEYGGTGGYAPGGPTGMAMGPRVPTSGSGAGEADPNYMRLMAGASGGATPRIPSGAGAPRSGPGMTMAGPGRGPTGPVRPSGGGLESSGQTGRSGTAQTAEATKATLSRRTVTRLLIP
jgi:hypothetical protein